MTPFKRWLRRVVERWLGRWHEGVAPPHRLQEPVVDFANMHPHAIRAEWVAFAQAWADECYRVGFIRGYEHVERQEDWHPDPLPEVVADAVMPGWQDSSPVELVDPDIMVLDEQPRP